MNAVPSPYHLQPWAAMGRGGYGGGTAMGRFWWLEGLIFNALSGPAKDTTSEKNQ